ncbi:MAG: immunoglobulin domain-containing protein [Verrucomicrobia bacterium]|nr:immunoglobulin domain-containing protein [Verrucomicrobiota bacterium]
MRNFILSAYPTLPTVLLILILSSGIVLGQVPPDGPPDIEPTPFQVFTPIPIGARVIPPFNVIDPGSTILADGQRVELMVVTSLPEGVEIQWLKDDEILNGETGPSLTIDEVSESDAGKYKVDITFNNSTNPSPEVGFQVVPFNEIDDVFETWSRRFFTIDELDEPSFSGEIADPDLDGIGNLVEYFFGLNPIKPGATPRIDLASFDNSSLSFSYTRILERPDVNLMVEGSNTLKEWVPLSTTQTTVTPGNESNETVEVELDWPLVPAYPRFIRLVVEKNEP